MKRSWMDQVTDALKASRDRDAWEVMITCAKEQSARLIDDKNL